MDVLALQRRLTALGLHPGPGDGVWGRRTRAAVRAFQTQAGLAPDGIVGPKTAAALAAAAPAAPDAGPLDPVWLVEARRWMGLREIAGPGSNLNILAWGRAGARWYANDDTPWCGAFVYAQIAAALPDEPLPANPLWARNWAAFGVGLTAPALGAALVFSRGSGGHVGFCVGRDAARLKVLGGNQSNAVTEAWLDRRRLLAIRWPRTVPAPSAPAPAAAGGPDSHDEA